MAATRSAALGGKAADLEYHRSARRKRLERILQDANRLLFLVTYGREADDSPVRTPEGRAKLQKRRNGIARRMGAVLAADRALLGPAVAIASREPAAYPLGWRDARGAAMRAHPALAKRLLKAQVAVLEKSSVPVPGRWPEPETEEETKQRLADEQAAARGEPVPERPRREKAGRCWQCDYDLESKELPAKGRDVCPKCGKNPRRQFLGIAPDVCAVEAYTVAAYALDVWELPDIEWIDDHVEKHSRSLASELRKQGDNLSEWREDRHVRRRNQRRSRKAVRARVHERAQRMRDYWCDMVRGGSRPADATKKAAAQFDVSVDTAREAIKPRALRKKIVATHIIPPV